MVPIEIRYRADPTQWAKTTSSGLSEILLGFTKNVLNSAIFGPMLNIFVYTIVWDVRNTFLAKIENRPQIAKFTVYILFQENF